MGIDAEPGIAEVLSGHRRIEDVLVSYDRGGTLTQQVVQAAGCVRVLPAGHLDANPWDTVSSPALEDAVRYLRRDSDIVLIACPPLLGETTASAIVAMSDGVVAVAARSTLDRAGVEELRAVMDGLPRGPLGIVLVQSARASAHPRPAARQRRAPQSKTSHSIST